MKTNVKLIALYIAYLLVIVLGGKLSAHFQDIAQKTYLGIDVMLSMAVLAVAVVLLVLVVIFRTLLSARTGNGGAVIMSVIFAVISAALLVYSCVYADFLYIGLSLSPDYLPLALTMLLTSDIFDLVVQLRGRKKG